MGQNPSTTREKQDVQEAKGPSSTNMRRKRTIDAAVRPLQKRELKKLQQWMDKRYRYTWSHHKEAPLNTMQRTSQNMQDIRNLLGRKSVQWKVEKRSLQPIGHVMRLSDERPAKRAVQGWIPLPKTVDRQR